MPQASSFPARTSSRPPATPGFFQRFADVRPGEGWLVGWACLILGGIVGAHVLLETARDALFLTKLKPSALSLVYIAMAVLGFLTARADQIVSRVFGRKNALVLALMVASTGTMLFYTSTIGKAGAFALYLWAGVIGTLLTVQFWLTAAQRFTPGQGRRIYGLLSAGGVLGAVVGGVIGALLAQQMSVKNLLPASAGIHLLTALVVTLAPPATELAPAPDKARVGAEIRAVRSNAYLTRVGILIQLSGATLLIVDYLFKSVMATRLPPGDLGIYLARYYAIMNAVALIVQVFVTMQVLQRMGTILALTLLPLCLLLSGAAGLVFGTAMLAVLLAKGSDGALRFSLHRVSTELLFLPLSNEERAKAKPLFDSVLARGTQALIAVVILLLNQFHLASNDVLGILIASLSLLWILVAWSLRAPYLERFRSTLGGQARARSFELLQLNLDSVVVLVEALSSPDESRVIGAMSLFHEGRRSNLIPALVLYHPSPLVLARALEVIPAPGRKDWVPLAERLLQHDDREVRLAAIRALGSSGHLDRIDPSAFSDMPGLRATAAFFVAGQSEIPAKETAIAEFLAEDADPQGQLALLEAIGKLGTARWADVVLELQKRARGELDRVLPLAMARTRDLRFVPLLVQRLAHREGRNEAREALAALGAPALDALRSALYDRTTDSAVRLHIPRAISRFGSRQAGEMLVDMLSQDLPGAVRYKALRGLGRVVATSDFSVDAVRILPVIEQNLVEYARMEMSLRILGERPGPAPLSGVLFFGLLADKRRQALERATRLLQLLHPREDLRRVYYALLSDEGSNRVAAAEILEVTSLGYGETLRGLLRVAAEPRQDLAPLESYASALSIPVPHEVDTLRELMANADPLVSALAASYAIELDNSELTSAIEAATSSNAWLIEHSSASLR